MHVVYTGEPFPDQVEKSMFLVGPTPRTPDVSSWRVPGALAILEKLGYDGHVFVPEFREDKFRKIDDSYKRHTIIPWETEGLHRADVIVAWVPRNLDTMPAFTTNVEFGEWYNSGKFLFGAPADAPKNDYLWEKIKSADVPYFYTLKKTLRVAVHQWLREGAQRSGVAAKVPLHIWRTNSFRDWYDRLKQGGVRFDDIRVLWTLRYGGWYDSVRAWAIGATIFPTKNHGQRREVIICLDEKKPVYVTFFETQ